MMNDPNLSTVMAFNDALNAANVDAMMACMTPDCVFENTYPAPDGERLEGQKAVRAFWEFFFGGAVDPHIEVEEIFAADEGLPSQEGSPTEEGLPTEEGWPSGEGRRVVMRWLYSWKDEQGRPAHIRGADIYRMQDGRIAEKLSYVKG